MVYLYNKQYVQIGVLWVNMDKFQKHSFKKKMWMDAFSIICKVERVR